MFSIESVVFLSSGVGVVLTILGSYVSIASIGKFSKLSSFVSKVRPKPKLYLSHSKPPKYSCEEYFVLQRLIVRCPQTVTKYHSSSRPSLSIEAMDEYSPPIILNVYAMVVYESDYADLVCVFPPYL